ncbi:MAG: S41 family peptidase [Marinilabiliaceae bacterium]|nr:S41 family peptidase [Marinilabiliaceae bacterium]
MKYKNGIRQVLMPTIIAVTLITGIFLGRNVLPDTSGSKRSGRLFIYPQSNKIETIINLISDDYVDTIDRNDLTEKLIPDILKHLDPHSIYIPAIDMKAATEELEGFFGGIGVQFNIQNDTVLVIRVIPGGPSEKVGLKAGDRIVSVNDSIIVGTKIDSDQVMSKLRGEFGTKVKVGIVRRSVNKILDFEITRGNIPSLSVDVSYMLTNTTGYIKISKITQNSYHEFLVAIAKLKNFGCRNLIVDLRDNSGGALDVSLQICNEFMTKGDLLVYHEGRSSPRSNTYANGLGTCQDMGLTVLIDEFSASASEIIAGAIQDNDRGVIVGRRSFGKGLVQNPYPLPDGSSLRLTIARYYTPSGRFIQKPYQSGIEDYHRDIWDRIEHGEMFEQDSISFDQSLKHLTKNGRVVYGGGGIMPDIFVPRDTSDFTNFYFKIRNLIYTFSVKYADDNRDILQKFTSAQEFDKYLETKKITDQLIKYAEYEGIVIDQNELKRSYRLINTQLKAYIARNIIDDDGFYPIIHQIDEVVKKAISVIESGDAKNILK